MKTVIPTFSMVCLGLICGVVPCTGAADGSRGFAFTDKVVLAYYYIWFSENNWIQTAAQGGRKEGLEGLHPLVGAYNSWDPTIIEKHMQQMNRALIDALAVSWWHDTRANGPNAILDIVFEKAVAHNLKITIDYEHGRAPLETVNHNLLYFLSRYQNHPAMLKVEGHPVVMIWTAWGHTPAEWQGKGLPGTIPRPGRVHAGGYRGLPVGGFHEDHARAYRRLQQERGSQERQTRTASRHHLTRL